MTSFKRQASRAKMTSAGGKLTALACHTTKRVNKAEDPTYHSTNFNLYEPNFQYSYPSIRVLGLLAVSTNDRLKQISIYVNYKRPRL